MINAVILDDDPLIRKNLTLLIEKYCPEIRIIAQAASGNEAMELFPRVKYDLVFSDIQLGDMVAFALFEKLGANRPIIFITAHENFAIDAIKLEAVDYLIKPIQPKELKKAVSRALKHIDRNVAFETMKGETHEPKNGKILIKTSDELHFLAPEKIVYCEADGAYTRIYPDDPATEFRMVTVHLKRVEELLPSPMFYRIHDSIIVNVNYIDHIKYQKRLCVVKLQKDAEKRILKISERKYAGFLDFLKNH